MKTVLFFLLLIAFNASAHLENSTDEFQRLVLSAQLHCPLLSCPALTIKMKTLSALESKRLNVETRKNLKLVADEMAQIWGDSILEGDYYSDEETQIEQIQTLYRGHSLIGYRITYSASAWETSSCEYKIEDKSSFPKCGSGKIVESAFVSADFTKFFQDSHAPAGFKAD